MRQLNHTGWMHNRVRMIVASFLIKDLRIDWQSGERYFMQHLIDADMSANNWNCQWCASTGTCRSWLVSLPHKPLSLVFCDPPYAMMQDETTRPQVMAWLRRGFAAAFVGLGARLALTER